METPNELRHISVEGTATVDVPPDIARITVHLKCVDADASVAKATVDDRSRQTIRLATSLGIGDADIFATQLALGPETEIRFREPSINKGTFVKRDITITLRRMDKYNELIQGLVDVPVSELKKVDMDVTNRTQVEQQAQRMAIINALESAECIAEELGVTLGPVYRVNAVAKLYVMGAAAQERNDGTDAFNPGTIAIQREVSVIYAIQDDNTSG